MYRFQHLLMLITQASLLYESTLGVIFLSFKFKHRISALEE